MWFPRPGLEQVELGSETVVWDPERGGIARFDGVTSLMWSALDGSTALADVIEDLAAALGVTPDTVEAGVVPVLERLAAAGLVESRSTGTV